MPVVIKYINITPETLKDHQDIMLAEDIMFITKLLFVVSMLWMVKLPTESYVIYRTNTTLLAPTNKIVILYYKRTFNVTTLFMEL